MTEKSKDWSGNSSIYACNHRGKESETAAGDFYATHPESIQLFLKKCAERALKLSESIYEPACGDGAISKILESAGYDVLSTDLYDRGFGYPGVDFLKLNKEEIPEAYKKYFKCIFTNPPYKYAQEFVEKALELADKDGLVIMFLKTTFLETKGRLELFKNHKLKYVWQYVNRQGCGKNGGVFKNGGAAAYAMFIWDNSYDGLPELDWIE